VARIKIILACVAYIRYEYDQGMWLPSWRGHCFSSLC
jgi:hypothetical protein